jgi:hypothetical protein
MTRICVWNSIVCLELLLLLVGFYLVIHGQIINKSDTLVWVGLTLVGVSAIGTICVFSCVIDPYYENSMHQTRIHEQTSIPQRREQIQTSIPQRTEQDNPVNIDQNERQQVDITILDPCPV